MTDKYGALVGQVEQLDATARQIAACVQQLASAATLDAGTYAFDAEGTFSRTYRVPYGAVAVENLTAADVTLEAGPSRGEAPAVAQTVGPGIFTIQPDRAGVYNVSGHTLTVYGPAGESVALQVFARPQPPAWR